MGDTNIIVADPDIYFKNCMNDVFTSLMRWLTHYILAKCHEILIAAVVYS